jgi:hypothetical protein
MSDEEFTDRVNTLEAGIDRLDRERIALLREIVQVLSKVVEAIPSDDFDPSTIPRLRSDSAKFSLEWPCQRTDDHVALVHGLCSTWTMTIAIRN